MIGLEFKEVSVIEEAYAKINLFLEVLGKREDGYHGIRSVMQTVSLHDTVNVRLSESGISMTCSTPALDCGASNLCIKAAKAFSSACGGVGAEITLTKVIPMQAGLGGGSADAAAVLSVLRARALPYRYKCRCRRSVLRVGRHRTGRGDRRNLNPASRSSALPCGHLRRNDPRVHSRGIRKA